MDVPPPPESAAEMATTGSAQVRQIEIDFPGWGVWRSDAKRWWAFRTAANPLSIDQLRAGCRLIVQADTVAQLRAAILAEIESARRPRS